MNIYDIAKHKSVSDVCYDYVCKTASISLVTTVTICYIKTDILEQIAQKIHPSFGNVIGFFPAPTPDPP